MITAKNLTYSYTGAPPYVLDNLNLEIRDGEYVSLVGDNGVGKSTLVRLILKLIRPAGGEIAVETERIGYVPQKSDAFGSNFPITVYEMLNSYRRLLKIRDKAAVVEALRQVGMEDCTGRLIGTLSGGQSQKVFIARALMGSPRLLVLDEPTNGVDAGSQEEIYGLLRTVNKENGITIVSVEHNLRAAVSNSTMIYHLDGGRGHLCTPGKYAAEWLKARGRDDSIA